MSNFTITSFSTPNTVTVGESVKKHEWNRLVSDLIFLNNDKINTAGGIKATTGTFTRDMSLASSTVTVSGLGFAAKKITIFASPQAASGSSASWGIGNSASGNSVFNDANGKHGFNGGFVIYIQDTTSGLTLQGKLETIGSDGFDIFFTNTSNNTYNLNIMWFAVG